MAGRWDSKSSSPKGPTALSSARRLRQLRRRLTHLREVDAVDPPQDLVDGNTLPWSSRDDPIRLIRAPESSREKQLGPQIALGHRQLPRGHALGGQEVELVVHQAQHLVDVLGRRADHDGHGADVLVGGPFRPDRVREPALLRTSWNSRLEIPPPSTWLSTAKGHRSRRTGTRAHPVHQVDLLGRPAGDVQGDHLGPGRGAGGAGAARRPAKRRSRSIATPRAGSRRRRRPPCWPAGSGGRRSCGCPRG